MIRPPAITVPTGQVSVTARAGAVVIGQVEDALLVTAMPVHWSLPVTVETLVEEQLVGEINSDVSGIDIICGIGKDLAV